MRRRSHLLRYGLVAAALGSGAVLQPAQAVETGMSLYLRGSAGFMSGFLPPVENVEVITPIYWHFDGVAGANVRNNLVEFGVDMNVDFAALQAIFITDWKPLGATYAFGGLVDYAWAGVDATIQGPLGNQIAISPRADGMSDTMVQPFILGWHFDQIHVNANMSVVLPTGEYETGQLSVGRNLWALMPQVAVTWFDQEAGWDISGAVTYVTAWENEATDYASGDILHLDWAVGKHWGEWIVGVAGNFAVQVEDDSGAGTRLGAYRMRATGIGPAVNYSTKIGEMPLTLSAKWQHDISTANTFEGDIVNVTATVAF